MLFRSGQPEGADIGGGKQILPAGAGKAPAHAADGGAQDAPQGVILSGWFVQGSLSQSSDRAEAGSENLMQGFFNPKR